ncbi:hypothetical protein ASPBRDRAFT_669968 [Aspergillus brasiliensis CBS 101740]|uniref:Major facilitator superfamily (MFS) profile domain-containing protein n=1 Tax=Aspergillus brasiliensis (strain CBS 101740 / IMI 381727 / IBT 21946) TaxID=767769 RepID=A0A1L9U249_ASPBC|nr:hypothetical protein ASPBRDRAFT_669968 [Aspergillus brasiliensis CBS 101740]
MRSFLGKGKTLQTSLTLLQSRLLRWLHPCVTPLSMVSCLAVHILTTSVNYVVGEKLGRRRTIWVAMAFVLVGAVLQTTAFTVPHLIVGRLVTGFGTGIKTSTVPMYQAELCDQHKRGRLVSAEVLFVGVGIVVAYWFDFGMSFVGGSVAWRLPIAFQVVFALVVAVLVLGLPESPRWLYKHGKSTEAMEVLCRVYDKEPTDEYILAERDAILGAIQLESGENTSRSPLSVFQNDHVKTRQRVLLAWWVQFMNQAGGINLVVYYAPSMLVQNVGLSARLAQILGGCINMMFMFGSIVPSFFLDRMGRRKTMIAGCAGLSLCMMMISALLSQAKTSNGHSYSSAAVTFFFLYMLIFGMSVNCVPWVYVPEILPLAARTRGTAIGISSNWLWNFTVVMITPVIINRLHWKAYLIFMATNALFVPAFYFFYPETSNLRLEDVDYIFSRSGNPVKNAQQIAAELKLHGRVDVLQVSGSQMSPSCHSSEEKGVHEARNENGSS